jgi:AcrR family transcriptional regulator
MGIAERKERQKAELREQILTAARTIVLERGYRGLSMRKIADAIEYSPAALYLHFASREEIALQLCREAFLELLGYMASAGAIADPYQRIFAIARSYVRFGMEKPESYRLIFMEEQSFVDSVMGPKALEDPDEPGTRAFEFLRATVEALIARGIFRPVDPEAAAHVIWAAVHGLVSLRLSCPGSPFEDIDALADLLCDTLMRGFSSGAGDAAG